MKKTIFPNVRNLMTLAFCAFASVAMAQTDAIKASQSEDAPEHLFTMRNGNGLTMTSYTSPTQTEDNAGKFAFYAESGKSILTTSTA